MRITLTIMLLIFSNWLGAEKNISQSMKDLTRYSPPLKNSFYTGPHSGWLSCDFAANKLNRLGKYLKLTKSKGENGLVIKTELRSLSLDGNKSYLTVIGEDREKKWINIYPSRHNSDYTTGPALFGVTCDLFGNTKWWSLIRFNDTYGNSCSLSVKTKLTLESFHGEKNALAVTKNIIEDGVLYEWLCYDKKDKMTTKWLEAYTSDGTVYTTGATNELTFVIQKLENCWICENGKRIPKEFKLVDPIFDLIFK